MSTASLYAVGSRVLADAAAALDTAGTPVARSVMYPGVIAWDSGEKCSLLACAFTRMMFTSVFPNAMQEVNESGCGANYRAADYTLQLLRCAPMPDAMGNVSAAQIDASAQQMMSDAAVLFNTVECSLAAMYAAVPGMITDFVLRQVFTVGPEGGLVGTQVDYAVGLAP